MRMAKHFASGIVIGLVVLCSIGVLANVQNPGPEIVGSTVPARIESTHPVTGGFWRQELTFQGAPWVKLHLASLRIGKEDLFLLTDAFGNENYRHVGPMESDFWLPSVEGDTAVLEIWPAVGSEPWGLLVDQAGLGFDQTLAKSAPVPESICGQNDMKDPPCPPADDAKRQASRAVGRMLWNCQGGMCACTGFLVSGAGHFLTNNHCVANQSDANILEVTWLYQRPQCGSGDPPTNLKSIGTSLVTTSRDLDYTLLFFNTNPAPTYGFLTLSPNRPAVGDVIWIAEHPGGGPKMFAILSDMDGGGNAKIQALDLNGFDYQPAATDLGYFADTEGGSSGSPVMNTSNVVVALHHAGPSGACKAGNYNQGMMMYKIYPEIIGYLGGGPSVTAYGGPTSGSAPLLVTFTATATGGTLPYTYDWDFGDGSAHSALQNPVHEYTTGGTFPVLLTIHDSEGRPASDNTLVITVTSVPRPTITRVSKLTSPFRLKVEGNLFQVGAKVLIGTTEAPQSTYKSSTKVLAGQGSALKALLPSGTLVVVFVRNPDGSISAGFPYTRTAVSSGGDGLREPAEAKGQDAGTQLLPAPSSAPN